MSVFKRFLKWLNESPYETAVNEIQVHAEEIKKRFDSMVGEPVISFIESYEREPYRYRVRPMKSTEWEGNVYGWMKGIGKYYKLVDRKTGSEYTAYISQEYGVMHSTERLNERLDQVVGLPFELNYCEKAAIIKVLVDRYNRDGVVGKRISRIRQMNHDRDRAIKDAQEKQTRLEFAKQFQ
jgi:hypothetical protein